MRIDIGRNFMLGYIGSHYFTLAVIVATIFMLTLGFVSIHDALTHRRN